MSMNDLCLHQLTVDLSRPGELISTFMQEFAYFAAEFPSSKVKVLYRPPAAVVGMAEVEAARFLSPTQDAKPSTPSRTCSQI